MPAPKNNFIRKSSITKISRVICATFWLSFGKLRDEILHREIFTTLTEAKVLIAEWKKEYNQARPPSAKGYKPPPPETKMLVKLTL